MTTAKRSKVLALIVAMWVGFILIGRATPDHQVEIQIRDLLGITWVVACLGIYRWLTKKTE